MRSHVYLLQHSSQPRFKIGKADDILSRARSFKWESIDFAKSRALAVSSNSDAFALERLLHLAFKSFRIDSEIVTSSGGVVDGASEWFRSECWPRLLRYLEENSDLHQHETVTGEELSELFHQEIERRANTEYRRAHNKEKNIASILRKEKKFALHLGEFKAAISIPISKVGQELKKHCEGEYLAGFSHSPQGIHLVLARRKSDIYEKIRWEVSRAETEFKSHIICTSLISSPPLTRSSPGIDACLITINRVADGVEDSYEIAFNEVLQEFITLPAIPWKVVGQAFSFHAQEEDINAAMLTLLSELSEANTGNNHIS